MVKNEEVLDFARQLNQLCPRQRENERKSASLIKEKLVDKKLDFELQDFSVILPRFTDYELYVDGERMECLPSGFKSGEIKEKRMIDSLHVEESDVVEPNINFNPLCSGISTPSFYNAPALAVSRRNVSKILESQSLEGRLVVEKEKADTGNILVGNLSDPSTVIFTHYDSLYGGFIDNAFSVSLLLGLLPRLNLDKVLLVMTGCEELAFDDPYYCYGYRQFETDYYGILKQCDEIVVADSMGRGETKVTNQGILVKKAFNVNNQEILDKTSLISGPYREVMDIYHSPEDTVERATHTGDAISKTKKRFEHLMKD